MDYILDEKELSIPSIEVDVKKDNKLVREIVLKLKDKMQQDNLVALSAPQIGYKQRIFCVKFTSKFKKKEVDTIHTYVNPIVTGIRNIVIDREKDPCLPDKEYIIVRNNDLSLIYQTPLGKVVSQKFSGKAVSIIQQMLDHIDGILISDTGLEIDERFDQASEEEKNALLRAYMESLDLYREGLNKYIGEDEELKSIKDAVDFIQSVRNGDTKLGSPISIEKQNN